MTNIDIRTLVRSSGMVLIIAVLLCTTVASPAAAAAVSPDGARVSKKVKNQRLAKRLIALWKAEKIKISNYSENRASDLKDRSLASIQLMDIAKTGRANLSTRCKNMGGRKTVTPDTRVLAFLVTEARYAKYTITTLFGQCHKTGSAHYVGRGVDFACTINYRQVDKVAARFDMKRNKETCARHYHWHYSIGGV